MTAGAGLIGENLARLIEVRPSIEHALDTIVGVPELHLEEIAHIGDDGIVGRLFQHARKVIPLFSCYGFAVVGTEKEIENFAAISA